MKIILNKNFVSDLDKQVLYISFDKPGAAQKIKKDLKNPFHFKKSIYFNDELVRDYVFKGYTSVYEIKENESVVEIFGFIK